MELNVLIAIGGLIGSGFSAYLGVRIALAEIRTDIKRLDKDVLDLESRLNRLEAPHFRRGE